MSASDDLTSGARASMRLMVRLVLVLASSLVALLALSACKTSGSHGGLTARQKAQLPAEIQAPYALFERKCSRCHSLSVPINSGVRDPEHWRKYVARMRKNRSSGITEADGEIILQFLFYYVDAQDELFKKSSSS